MTTTIDCTVEVRKWVLVSSPSRWSQKGQRVIVYSPMFPIPKDASLVPVKRSRDEENSVCFLPKGDIEKDSSRIYEKMQISRAPLFVDAHGVAIMDGFDDGFRFSRGDRFWIHIGCNTEHYKMTGTVPVINLETFEEGTIDAQNVCVRWFPKIQGPNEELWTPGGEIRSQKLCGSKKFAYWSFVIRQKLDGAPPTVDTVQIPGKDSNMQDRYELALADRRSLFVKRLQCLTPKPSIDIPSTQPLQSRSSLSPTNTSSDPSTALLTPPSSVNSPEEEIIPALDVEERPPINIEANGRRSGTPNLRWAYKSQTPSLARSYRRTSSHQRRHTRRLSIDTNGDSADEPLSSDDSLSSSYSSQSQHCIPENTDRRSEHSSPDEDDDFCVKMLVELAKDDRYNRTQSSGSASFMDGHFGNDLDSIHERYAQEKKDPAGRVATIHRARNANLCELRDPDCKYSVIHTAKHYHSPADKCLSGSRHEHCICRLYPEPGGSGDCILRLKRPRLHQCCYWGNQRWIPRKVEYDDRKLKESLENAMPVYDLSGGEGLKEFYTSYDDTQRVGEIPPTVRGEVVDDIKSVDEVMLGEVSFYPPYLASFSGVDSDEFCLSFLDGSQSS